MKTHSIPALMILPLFLSGCNLAEKLATVGQTPELSQIQDPTLQPGYQPISMPMPEARASERRVNSLWENGSRAFFKDQRARSVGDIVTIEVDFNDQQSMEMTPNISQNSKLNSSFGAVFGLEKQIARLLPKNMDLPNVLNMSNAPNMSGSGKYDVSDKLKFKISSVITQILPNGNMVIEGRREMRLNNEVREIVLRGVIRREDVSAGNTVKGEKVAEARLSVGGRGDLSDVNSAPWFHQLVNKVSPF